MMNIISAEEHRRLQQVEHELLHVSVKEAIRRRLSKKVREVRKAKEE